jgi:thymidylate kinase
MARRHAGRYRVIDASQPLAQVQASLDRVMRQFMQDQVGSGAESGTPDRAG